MTKSTDRQVPISAFQLTASVSLLPVVENKTRRFSGVGYSGDVIESHPWWGRLVIDLQNAKLGAPSIAVLRDHDPSQIVGSTDDIKFGTNVQFSGPFQDTSAAAEVMKLSDNGFPWQASVHVYPTKIDELKAGASETINGREVSGPAVIFRSPTIKEISFTAVGADSRTPSAALAALLHKDVTMPQDITQDEQKANDIAKLRADLDAKDTLLAALQAEVEAMKTESHRVATEARLSAVKVLFSDTGSEFSADAAKPYLALSGEHFDSIAKNMRSARNKNTGHLFSVQASGDGSGDGGGESSIVADAKRRAAAVKTGT